jgi:hypothetical protein
MGNMDEEESMTSKVERDEDKKPIGMSFYEIGKGEIDLIDFTIKFEARYEMEQADDGSFVSCGFERFEKVEIIPDGDVSCEIPYVATGWLDGWLLMQWSDEAMKSAQEDAERRANLKD